MKDMKDMNKRITIDGFKTAYAQLSKDVSASMRRADRERVDIMINELGKCTEHKLVS